jgi:ribosomal protein L6P/L9E
LQSKIFFYQIKFNYHFNLNIIHFLYWKYLVFKKNQKSIFFFFNEIYYFIINFSYHYLIEAFLDYQTNCYVLKSQSKSRFNNLFFHELKSILNSFAYFFFIKLKFKGKGYYIYKNDRQTITFKFGYSHRIYLYFSFIKVQFIAKINIFLFGINKKDLFFLGTQLYLVKPINIFTGRGIRFNRQIIYRKTGKIGSYR